LSASVSLISPLIGNLRDPAQTVNNKKLKPIYEGTPSTASRHPGWESQVFLSAYDVIYECTDCMGGNNDWNHMGLFTATLKHQQLWTSTKIQNIKKTF